MKKLKYIIKRLQSLGFRVTTNDGSRGKIYPSNRLQPFYSIPFKQFPKNSGVLFTKSFEPRIFSVMVSATVGDSTQRLYAILERIKKSQDTKTQYDIYIRTFYWV